MTAQQQTIVVNLHKEPFDVYIGRAGKGHDGYFGNPFLPEDPSSPQSRQECLEMFRHYFLGRVQQDAEFRRRVCELKGKRLGCFCAPKSCHGDVIAEYVDSIL